MVGVNNVYADLLRARTISFYVMVVFIMILVVIFSLVPAMIGLDRLFDIFLLIFFEGKVSDSCKREMDSQKEIKSYRMDNWLLTTDCAAEVTIVLYNLAQYIAVYVVFVVVFSIIAMYFLSNRR